MNNKKLIYALIAVVVLAGAAFFIFRSPETPVTSTFIANFEQCAKAGYPIMESFPRQCRTPDGKVYTEENGQVKGATATGGCFIGGCSSQVCSDEEGVSSNCEYRPEYACYKTGSCGRQADGQCGWDDTPELQACLEAAVNSMELLK